MTPDEVRGFFDAHRTVRRYTPDAMPPEHLDVILHAAQRAPTDATAQMYSFVRLVDPALRADVAAWTGNAHFATAAEAFVICADVRRLRRLLELRGYAYGEWPAASVHFAIGDAVMAAQNMLLAAEMLGYAGCWIGGVMSALDAIVERLDLPEGVLPFAGLTLGVPAESPAQRPRLPRALVVHEDRYREPGDAELDAALEVMAPITSRGDWALSLSRYFAAGGSMEQREVILREVLRRQGFTHVGELDALADEARQAGFDEFLVRRRGERFEAWLDRVERAHRGEGGTPTAALREAVGEARRDGT